MVLSFEVVDPTSTSTSSLDDRCPSLIRKSSHSIPLPAFHYTDTDDSYSDVADSDIDGAPTFHYESDCDDSPQKLQAEEEEDDEAGEYGGRRTSLTISTASSPSPSHSTSHAVYVSPSTFFASPAFASLLSTRAASITLSTPTHSSTLSSSSSPHSSSSSPSSSLPTYSPHSSCVAPRMFAWQLEEAAVLFWERKTVLTRSETQTVNTGSSGGGEGTVRPARFVHHSRHASL